MLTYLSICHVILLRDKQSNKFEEENKMRLTEKQIKDLQEIRDEYNIADEVLEMIEETGNDFDETDCDSEMMEWLMDWIAN